VRHSWTQCEPQLHHLGRDQKCHLARVVGERLLKGGQHRCVNVVLIRQQASQLIASQILIQVPAPLHLEWSEGTLDVPQRTMSSPRFPNGATGERPSGQRGARRP
jgi:hypothetical protein